MTRQYELLALRTFLQSRGFQSAQVDGDAVRFSKPYVNDVTGAIERETLHVTSLDEAVKEVGPAPIVCPCGEAERLEIHETANVSYPLTRAPDGSYSADTSHPWDADGCQEDYRLFCKTCGANLPVPVGATWEWC